MRRAVLIALGLAALSGCGTQKSCGDGSGCGATRPTALVASTGGGAIVQTASPAASSTTVTSTATPDPDAGSPAAIAGSLTPAQLVGERLIASFRGTTVPPPALLARIRRGELAGVLLFSENAPTITAARKLVDRLQAIPRPGALKDVPLLIMVDQEGGLVRRLSDAPPTRSALSAARAGSVASVEADGTRTAAALLRAGVSVDLAPVADVPRKGSALLSEDRTYGTTVAQVRRYAPAFAKGLVTGGVQATSKHFPGFGAATVNSDTTAATIRLSAATLRSTDESVTRAVLAAGAQLVMLANARYPALDPARPATLSHAIATTELRRRLGFTGVSITDDLEALGLGAYGGPGTLAVDAVKAGADLLLHGSTYQATETAAAALDAAHLPHAALVASATRVIALRQDARPG